MSRRTGWVWHERYAWHDTGTAAGVPPAGGYLEPYRNFESPESKARFAGLVEVSGLIDDLTIVKGRLATLEELARVHTTEYIGRIRQLSDIGGGDAGDGMTPFGRGSFEIASLAVGGVINAVDAVMRGEVDNAYALVRPPGHHAERDRGRGYCLFSNVGVSIEHARATYGLERIAIVDYDVHHGNGAQWIFWEDPGVLKLSIHQDRLFPQESGSLDERGAGDGEGYVINVPLPGGSGDGAYVKTMEKVVAPALRAYRPELIMVSSGFDPSALDPLGRMTVTADGFRKMANHLVDLAEELCDGRIVFSHEGGYSPVAVPFCGLAVLEEMSGIKTDVVDEFAFMFERSTAKLLQPWQEEVIDQAAMLVEPLRSQSRV